MRKIVCLLAFVLMAVLCCASSCLGGSADIRTILIKDFGLADDEILTDFMAEYGATTEESLKELNILYLYDRFVEAYHQDRYPMERLLGKELSAEDLGIPDTGRISRILLLYNVEQRIDIMLWDLKANTAYVGDGELMYTLQDAKKYPLSREKGEELIGILEKYGYFSWELSYISGRSTPLGWESWVISAEDEDGRVAFSSGSGSDGDRNPEHLLDIFTEAYRLLTT